MINYAIRNKFNGKYIAIDNASGGYPYDTDFPVKIWSSKEEAYKYYKVFLNEYWELVEIDIKATPVSWI